MMHKQTIPRKRVFNHLLFWLAFVIVNGFVWGYCGEINPNYFSAAYRQTIAILPVLIAGVYLNLYLLLPHFFLKKKYGQYLLFGCMVYIAMAALVRGVLYYGFGNVNDFSGTPTVLLDAYYLGKIMIMNVSPVFFISSAIKLWEQWYLQQQAAQELQKEKLDAELKFLKAQMHPHFLFNTLNNLYSLTLSKSDQAPQMLLKLSDLMSYMLYDSQENKIALEKEIKHIQNYVALEQLRYGNRLDVQFIVTGSMEGKYVAPLVLMPFVENAFKHGASSDIDTSWIRINLMIEDETLWVKVENSQAEQMQNNKSIGKGIGLVNVSRRLDLLYPEKFNLSMKKEKDQYAIDLKLSLI